MELQKLQNEIRGKFAFDEDIDKISRNLFLCFGENIADLESFIKQYEFPVNDEGIHSFWRWINLSSQDNSNKTIQKTLLDLISLQTTGEALDKKNLQLITDPIQIFIIFDLTIPEADSKLKAILSELDEIIENLKIEFFIAKIGVLITDRIINQELKHIPDDDLHSLYKGIEQRFDYLFFLQCQNEQNISITSDEEWISLIANLLYYLAMYPTRVALGEFKEFIKRHQPSRHGISAFSSTSYTLPMNEIVQYVLLSKGSDLLKETYFEIEDEELNRITNGKVEKFKSDNHIVNVEQFPNALLEDSSDQILSPLPVLDNLSSDSVPGRIVEIYRTVIQNLDSYLSHNKSVLKAKAEQFYSQFEYSLIETLDSMLNSYKGAAVISRKFMGDLTEHLNEQLEESKKLLYSNSTSDIAMELDNLQAEAEREPPLLAMISRLIPFAFISILLIIQILNWNTGYQSVLLFGTIIMSLGVIGLSFILRHAWKNRFVDKLIHLRRLLDKQWKERLDNICLELYHDLLPKYIEKLNSVKEDIEKLNDRLDYLFKYIDDHYQPHIYPHNRFWVNVVKEKSEMSYFFRFVNDEYIRKEPEAVVKDKLLKLWWRLGNGEELNPLEWEILEKAAMRLIPYSHAIFGCSICDYLIDNKNKKLEILNQLQQCYLPFVKLDPNRKENLYDHGVLEWRKDSCGIVDEAETTLKKNISSIEVNDSLTDYRFSVLYFKEGINYESLKI